MQFIHEFILLLMQIKELNIVFYACYHILSAYLSLYLILGYDIKINHLRDNYT